MQSDISLILFSGMAADARVFAPQKRAFPNLIVPDWPAPAKRESLSAYCERLAKLIDPGQPCVIGGASFGGIIALEIARYLNPQAVLLIGSVRSPNELPWRVRLVRPARYALAVFPLSLLQLGAAPLTSRIVSRRAPFLSQIAAQFRNANRAVLRRSLWYLLSWKQTPTVNCPVFRIHGQRDRILHWRGNPPAVLIPDGGHVISLTHAEQVNEFIRDCLSKVKVALT